MERMVLDLGIAREAEAIYIREWKYLYIGDVTGDVKLRLDGRGWWYPSEFDKVTGVEDHNYLYVTNTTQAGKELIVYFEEKKPWAKHLLG